jgi:chromosome segregation protein
MRLKRIKLAGFKSFVEPTTIPFDGAMTAIVGPNGCGKSNVIDAVRWVLGESNAKNLRGDAMTDVIFNGSASRKPVGQCSVELVFDNSAGRIAGEYASYNELSVKRLVTRDAQSFYYLNGAKCRRRDVTDLFLGTGLGPRSYAIIEQGMISKLIESKPQELRIFIEEAAGVSKYKERRKDTVTRIKHTHENLIRLDDVRSELGQQIDKLQEQAQTAQRYTTLKAEQRTLQGQITALKWLVEADKIAASEQAITQLTAQLGALQTNQQGDETQLVALHVQQEYLNEEIAAEQATKYQLATNITKLEQEQKYSQSRKAQIQQELQDTKAQCIAHEQALKSFDSQLADAQMIVTALEPDFEIQTAQQQQLTVQLNDAQRALTEFSTQTNAQATAYQQSKAQSEQYQSQIQALHSVRQKSQSSVDLVTQGLTELGLEAQDIAAEVLIQESLLDSQLSLVSEQHTMLVAQQSDESVVQGHLDQMLAQQAQIKHQIAQDEVALTALQTLQNAQTITRSSAFSTEPLWQWLSVEPQDAHWFEPVLHFTQQPDITTCETSAILDAIVNEPASPVHTWLASAFTSTKVVGSLAEKCLNERVPAWFNTIHLVSDKSLSEATLVLDSLPHGSSVLVNDGVWLQQGMVYHIGQSHDGDSAAQSLVARCQQIDELTVAIASGQQQSQDLQRQIDSKKEELIAIRAALTEAVNANEQAKQALQIVQQTQRQLVFQQQQNQLQQAKLSSEKSNLLTTLADETVQLEELNETMAEYSIQLDELSALQDGNIAQEKQLSETVTLLQHQVQQIQTGIHQSELALQKARSSYSFVVQNKSNQEKSLADVQMKIRLLEDQIHALAAPYDEHQVQLMMLLEQQVALEATIKALQAKAAELVQTIKQTEAGQQGNQHQVETIKAKIQSQELSLQGNRVRAAGIVEQLEQIDTQLSTILPDLPDDADPTALQRELEQVTENITQLGAVNLAAIAEYEVQFQRKTNLDQQNTDLCSALSTLESAMKKIDNETKARFKATYDQVNADLKSLFPKVFGGGTAYLELTGDDMLDTGVTIMARPPGKKNSTIHLLSGGEKALTALSLVFAIFRLNPAPFCLLDEVDAPLDDANVGRFCKLVSEMSKTVQFIYISHNKIAMEMASHLTGVTMAEPGVSRMVAVDIDEAVAITQA